MLNNKIKGVVVGLLAGSMLTGGLVFAKSGNQWIEASYDNIKLYVNGSKVDTSSNEPFIYDGSTYLPVRAVAEALGQNVDWDGNTKTVSIGSKPSETAYLIDVCPPYDIVSCDIYSSSQNGQSFTMAGERYSNGIRFGGWYYAEYGGHALFNLNGQYSAIDCMVGHTDWEQDQKSVSFVVDGKTVKTIELEPECLPKKVSIPLNYGLQLKILVGAKDGCHIGIGNMTVR